MVPSTPQEWLPILAKRMDDRASAVAKRRRYSRGEADLPEMGRNTRASWEAFQKKARRNYGGLAAKSLANRIQALSVTLGDGTDAAGTAALRRVWRDNRMAVQIADARWDALVCGVGYLVLGADEDGRAVITREKPEWFYAEPDPLRPWKARATIKTWRDEVAGLDYAVVTAPGAAQAFVRPVAHEGVTLRTSFGGEWSPMGDLVPFDGTPPVAILDGDDDRGVIEPHFDVIDAINLGKLQRMVTTAMQAYRQRALKQAKDAPPMPEKDEAGNPIDWEKVFSPAPGALWDLPEGIDVWESQQTDIRPLLDGEKQDAQDFAAQTETPISVLIPDGQNQSAQGAANATHGQVSRASDYIERFRPGLSALLARSLAVEGVDIGDQTVEVVFAKPEHVSVSEKYAAAAQAKAAGEPLKSIQRNILGYSPEQVAQAAADLAEEQLAAATLVAAVAPAPAVAGANA